MADVKILDKKVRINVRDAEDTIIGQIRFNPDSPQVRAKFMDLLLTLQGKTREMRGVEFTEEEIASLNKELTLEALDEFDAAGGAFGKARLATDLEMDTVRAVCAGFDDIFGAGVCDLFLQGDLDVELLVPMIDAVTPHFDKASEGKTAKYMKKK